jgi:serine/threonine protein kinase
MPTPRTFTPQFEIDFNELILEKQISEGGYGIIYKGRWRETVVAVKMLKIEGISESHVRDFLCKYLEINILIFLVFLKNLNFFI